MPEEVVSAHAEVPWRDMSDMRNVIVHGYHQVDLKIVWDTIQNDLPGLIEPLEQLLRDETKE